MDNESKAQEIGMAKQATKAPGPRPTTVPPPPPKRRAASIHNEPVEAKHFIGKTITGMNIEAANQIVFEFSNGEKLALHIDCNGFGLPVVQVCNTCIDSHSLRKG